MKLSQNGYLRKPDEVLLVVNVTDLKINYLFKKISVIYQLTVQILINSQLNQETQIINLSVLYVSNER